jgi:hypothetical protein
MSVLVPLALIGLLLLATIIVLAMRVPLYPVYWTTGFIPELASLPVEERRRVWRKCKSQAFRHWESWAASVVFALCVVGGPMLTGLVIWPQVHGSAFLGVLAGAPIGGVIFGQVRASMARPYIRAELQSEQAIAIQSSGERP